VTATAAQPTREDTEATRSWEVEARALAGSQQGLERPGRWPAPFFAPSRLAAALEQARERLASGTQDKKALQKPAEWFLDNYHLVRRVARQVAQELPRGFVGHLPRLSTGPGKGLPRVYWLSTELVAKTGLAFDRAMLGRFVRAYQETSTLSIAELWAFPMILRIAVLTNLVQSLSGLGVIAEDASPVGPGHVVVDPATGVERAIRALRLFAELDWKVFFEQTSRVEAMLRADPAGIYAQMDFATCDLYRKTIEELAWVTRIPEEDVAARALALASRAVPDERRGHVGYYLVDVGRSVLEQELGYGPKGLERVRRMALGRPTLAYLGTLSLVTAALVVLPEWYAVRSGAGLLPRLAVLVLTLGAAAVVAVAIVQWAFAKLLRPHLLSKLDFEKGLPEDARTLVVVPTLLGTRDDIARMAQRLELHYLSNPDPQLRFALLTDDADALEPPASEDLLDRACEEIASLNAKHGEDGTGPFHLLHRQPRWNASEECFMGWERKRGKLEELNRLLRGDKRGSYVRHEGAPEGLERIRFVITLDSDTELPMGSARRLIGVLAHPLNRATFDEKTGRVASGYTIVQPRVQTSPASSSRSRFQRIFAGDTGFDIYTHATSDLYQDLFASGIYVGKGIYDVDAFTRSLEGRTPENAILSHDLFEGIHGRAALASDVVVFEDYPTHYAAYARRMHRWICGDWQLLPWLLPEVPSSRRGKLHNRLSLIDRWKIADNLRRSLTAPLLVLLLLCGWTWLPGAPLFWTLVALSVLFAPLLPAIVRGRPQFKDIERALLGLVFLVHEAAIVVDAVVRTLARVVFTHTHLLQWTSAADIARTTHRRSRLWRQMLASPLLAVLSGATVAWVRPSALLVGLPVLLAWFFAPAIARWTSRDFPNHAKPLGAEDVRRLRQLARRTWLFFETFVGPGDQWLPVDNYQAVPREQVAHRTSPTNIGMMLLSTLSAYDLGYLGPGDLLLRLQNTLESVERLEHYRGHLLNWYETKNLQPLLPRYVSTVDSGNFAGCLIALEQGLKSVAHAPVLRREAWNGITDLLDLLEEALGSTEAGPADSLRSVLATVRRIVVNRGETAREAHAALGVLCDETAPALDSELIALLDAGAYQHEAETLHALRTWVDRFHHQLYETRRELDALLPWLSLADEPAATALTWPGEIKLDEIPGTCHRLATELAEWEERQRRDGSLTVDLEASTARLREAFHSAEQSAEALRDGLLDVARRAQAEAYGMDFRLLFDPERKLFRIGYNVTLDTADAHHYDLLASEARLASYLAIVKHDAPESHWYALGRPMTHVAGAPALLSWGGTMFEYLMPNLLMRGNERTLLGRSSALAVEAQIAYARERNTPWGVSESAYGRLDPHQTYQYRSFGVPGLGFRRHLTEDRVVAPYASMLAISLRPRAVVDNLAKLEAMGMLGMYGLFEAVDFDPEHAPSGRSFVVVRSFMAHHQGMLLVALDNYLHDDIMVERFHSDPLVEVGGMLLGEPTPGAVPAEWPAAEGPETEEAPAQRAPSSAPSWSARGAGQPDVFVLGNGRLTTWLTDSGGGGLRWHGLALTNYQPDPTSDTQGTWIYLRDRDNGRVWRATSADGRTTFSAHKIDFHRRDQGLSVHVDVTIAAADDVEVRQITLHNETDRSRRLVVASASEPALLPVEAVTGAFSRLFVESEYVPELDGLVFTRRHRALNEERAALVHRLVVEGSRVTPAGFETDRAAFFGRSRDPRVPESMSLDPVVLHGSVGTVLDPVMSLRAHVELAPQESVTLAFVTAVDRSRSAALELARRYGSMHAVRWAFRDAEQESLRRLKRARLNANLLPAIQHLLSALVFAEPSLRAPGDVIAEGHAEKRRLWGRGISGDFPILLVRVHDAQAPLFSQVIAAHRYFRASGVRVDLVLVDEQATGYVTDGVGTLRSVLARHDVDDWIDRRGGIHVVTRDQLPEEEERHLEASARVVLDTRDDSLASRFAKPAESAPRLPRFEPTLAEERTPPSGPRRPSLMFDNGIGGFSEDGREYVISVQPGKPTPAPWCNVLANPDFGCLVSESSLGCTWSTNSSENRLTPWRNDPLFDTPSESVYLRDEETGEVWSPTPLPAGLEAETLVRHGMGYTKYLRQSHDFEQELTVFVPADAPVKLVRLRIKNLLPRHRRVTATYYAEWVLGSTAEEQRAYVVSGIDRPSACLLATSSWKSEFKGRFAFLASELRVHGFTADRTEFLGRRGDYARPEALERWGLAACTDAGVDPCAALQVHLDLGPGEEIETHFVLGQGADRDAALALAAHFRKRESVDAAWDALTGFWEGLTGSLRVKTPEPSMDLMLNRWLLYQTIASRLFGRTAFYQSSGAFGFRDQLQDVLALLVAAPARARAHILESAAHQFEEGDVLHWWHPPSGSGVRTRCSDDLVWLVYVTAEYVAATGDVSILDEPVPFLSAEPLKREEHDRYAEFGTSAAAPLFEHCRRAMQRGFTQGRHGLPLMGDSDWNDGMNRVGSEGRGESVWLGWFLCATASRFASLCERLDEHDEAENWRARAESLRASLEENAWDGGWYLRAFHDDGSALGSTTSRECRIDSIAQSWAVLSGSADTERARLALHAADDQLVREEDRLVLLLWPPFASTAHDPGYIRAYPRGVRENGGQYTHAATWLGWAYTALGDGAHAERIFRLLNPVLRARTSGEVARYRVEPYVLAGDIYSCSPWIARGGWSWYTGAAGWAYRLGVEAILGLRKEDGQLRIDPCIPSAWKGFEAWIKLGGQEVHVVVDNPDAVGGGVAEASLDGAPLDSGRIPLDPGGLGKHEVHIRLGSKGQRKSA
jgi:cyclic beta-1,2-glucan synthetase